MNSPADNSLPSITAGYLHQIRKKMILMGGLLAGGAVLAVYAVALGSYGLSFEKLMAALIGKAEGPAAVVVWSIRLPRVAASVVTGWGLALAGLFVQSVLRNPRFGGHRAVRSRLFFRFRICLLRCGVRHPDHHRPGASETPVTGSRHSGRGGTIFPVYFGHHFDAVPGQ